MQQYCKKITKLLKPIVKYLVKVMKNGKGDALALHVC